MNGVDKMNNIAIRLQNELEIINQKIKIYERKSYDIFSNTTMINDRVEYDRLIGKQRGIELCINIVQSELREQEISSLKAQIEQNAVK